MEPMFSFLLEACKADQYAGQCPNLQDFPPQPVSFWAEKNRVRNGCGFILNMLYIFLQNQYSTLKIGLGRRVLIVWQGATRSHVTLRGCITFGAPKNAAKLESCTSS